MDIAHLEQELFVKLNFFKHFVRSLLLFLHVDFMTIRRDTCTYVCVWDSVMQQQNVSIHLFLFHSLWLFFWLLYIIAFLYRFSLFGLCCLSFARKPHPARSKIIHLHTYVHTKKLIPNLTDEFHARQPTIVFVLPQHSALAHIYSLNVCLLLRCGVLPLLTFYNFFFFFYSI